MSLAGSDGADGTLELELQVDRARRERLVAIVFVVLCTAAAAFYYVTIAPVMTPDPSARVIEVRLTLWGWLQATWIGGVIVIAGLVNVVRFIRFTLRLRELRGAIAARALPTAIARAV